MDEHQQWEVKIYYCHDSVEKILRALYTIIKALNSGKIDDALLLQFDELRKSKNNEKMHTMLSTDSVTTLLQSLPQKYSLEILLA